jgi:hypothetical protein
MDLKKTIKINPRFLTAHTKKRKNTRRGTEKQRRALSAIKPNNIKRQLIDKIKHHHKKQRILNNRVDSKNPDTTEILNKDFNQHMLYVEKVINDKTRIKQQKKQRRIKKKRQSSMDMKPLHPSTVDIPLLNPSTVDIPLLNPPTVDIPLLNPPTSDIPLLNPPTSDIPLLHLPTNDTPLLLHPPTGDTPLLLHPPTGDTPLLLHPPTGDTPVLHSPTIDVPSLTDLESSPIVFKQLFTPRHNTLKTNRSKYKIEPKYGCLKNGKKPTYSQYNNTLKHKKHTQPTPPNQDENIIRKQKLHRLQQNVSTIHTQPRLKRTVRKYKLGKHPKNSTIRVLIKSGKVRKNIQQETSILHTHSLYAIKQYLRQHNLIKIGTTAPESMLRKLYVDSYSAGNIYNNNTDNLLHNYVNESVTEGRAPDFALDAEMLTA